MNKINIINNILKYQKNNKIKTAIDYNISIDILREINSHFNKKSDNREIIMYYKDGHKYPNGGYYDFLYEVESYICCDSDDYDDENNKYKILNYRHKLQIIVYYFDTDSKKIDSVCDFDDFYDMEYEILQDNIFFDINLDLDKKEVQFEAYLFNSSAECDISSPNFKYIDKFNTWILHDGCWDAYNGIVNDENAIYCLYFGEYFNKSYE